MATLLLPKNVDFAAVGNRVGGQFKNLNFRDPSTWPALPRYLAFLVVIFVVVAVLWLAWLNSYSEELDTAQNKEQQLREDYKKKLVQAANLDALHKQREQVLQYVTQMEKKLPGKAEIDQLLSDITQAGLGRSLQFDLFRPGQMVVRDYYAELPISIKVIGRYHDIGAFASDIAALSRIVTLNNLSITPIAGKEGGKDRGDGSLSMEVTAKTFRYLDPSEIAAQRKPATTPVAGGSK